METARSTRTESASAAAPLAAPAPAHAPAPVAAAVPAPQPKSGRRPFLILAVVAVLAVIGVGVYHVATAGREGTDDAQIAADVVPIGARVSGVVAKVRIQENQLVKRGDLLIEIDPADYDAKVQQAAAEVATAKAQAAAAEAQVQIVEATSKGGLESARAALSGSTVEVGSAGARQASARAALARADADLKKAEIDLARARTLREANAVPQERLDTAQIAFEGARAAKAQAEAQVSLAEDARRSAESRVGEARGRVSQSAPIAPQIAAARANADLANARVRGAEAALALAKLSLDYTKVVAPSDGRASKLTVHDGQLVGVGQPLIELVPTASYVVANFKETQLSQMRVGQPAEISIDAFPGRTLTGRIESLTGGTGAAFSLLPADNATGNFVKVVQRVPVRIAWVNPPTDIELRAGLSADVTVDVRK